MTRRTASAALLLLCLGLHALAQEGPSARAVSGEVLTARGEAVEGVTVLIRHASGEQRVSTGAEGRFRATAPAGPLTLKFFGRNIALVTRTVAAGGTAEGLRIRVAFLVPPVHESVVIEASGLDPSVDRRNEAVYEDTLFLRDDQLTQTLHAGLTLRLFGKE